MEGPRTYGCSFLSMVGMTAVHPADLLGVVLLGSITQLTQTRKTASSAGVLLTLYRLVQMTGQAPCPQQIPHHNPQHHHHHHETFRNLGNHMLSFPFCPLSVRHPKKDWYMVLWMRVGGCMLCNEYSIVWCFPTCSSCTVLMQIPPRV
jgi:hypothetical protein